eukprot:TRINITY_DN20377_c0_g1_i7.p1 TRINITY_DN20377_c0_g1~~TRINITY_DN20377_c0_g1_i7.p1  ORF type:complete len:221 (+),score=28.04 TRINITY_DN20377_c0_g1_i7:289-951(+)
MPGRASDRPPRDKEAEDGEIAAGLQRRLWLLLRKGLKHLRRLGSDFVCSARLVTALQHVGFLISRRSTASAAMSTSDPKSSGPPWQKLAADVRYVLQGHSEAGPLDESSLPAAPSGKRDYQQRACRGSEAGIMKSAVIDSCKWLGRPATGKEILETIIGTPSIWSACAGQLNREENKHTTRRQKEVWMANLRRNLGRWCECTGELSKGKKLWQLKEALMG